MAMVTGQPPKMRIRRGTKISMLSFAAMCDLAPPLMFIMALLIMFGVGSAIADPVASTVEAGCDTGLINAVPGAAGIEAAYGISRWAYGLMGIEVPEVTCGGVGAAAGVATIAGMVAFAGLGMVAFFPIFAAISAAIAGVVYALTFTFWFGAKGINFWRLSPRRMLSNMLTLIGESIPFVNIIPFMTMNVWMLIQRVQKEDKKRIAAYEAAVQQAAGRRAQQRVRRAQPQNVRAQHPRRRVHVPQNTPQPVAV